MKVKPYTGNLEVWARSVIEALSRRLTVRDNVAAEAFSVVWNSDEELTLEPQTRVPRAIMMLRASLQSTPSAFVSGGSVNWEPLPDGRILITGIGSLTGGVPWDVDLLLVED